MWAAEGRSRAENVRISGKISEDLKLSEKVRLRAMVTADEVELTKTLSPKLIYIHSSGLVDNRSSLITRIASGLTRYLSIGISIDQLHNPNVGTCCGVGSIQLQVEKAGCPTTVSATFSAAWVAAESQWKLAMWHSGQQPQSPRADGASAGV